MGKAARAALILLVILQLPFTICGVFILNGVVSGNLAVLVPALELVAASGILRHQGVRVPSSTCPPQTTEAPAAETRLKAELIEEQAPPAVASLPAPPAVTALGAKPDGGGPRKRISDLPTLSSAQWSAFLADHPDGFAVDYISVPSRPSQFGGDEEPVHVRLRNLPGPRLLFLASRPGVSWRFDQTLPAAVQGLVIASPSFTGDDTLINWPVDRPAIRVVQDRSALPFVLSAVPDCREDLDGLPTYACPAFVGDGVRRAPVQQAEAVVEELVGQRIASVSAAFADDKDRAVLVPEEVVTDEVRQRIEMKRKRHEEAFAAANRRIADFRRYESTWFASRKAETLDLLQLHPPVIPSLLTPQRPDLIVISGYEGKMAAGKPASVNYRNPTIKNYDDYASALDAMTGRIDVSVDVDRPAVIVVSAHRAVEWRFSLKNPEHIVAIHVEGLEPPAVSGVPANIPLSIRSVAYGDQNATSYIPRPNDEKAMTARDKQALQQIAKFQDMYQGSQTFLFGKYKLESLEIDAKDMVREQE